MQADKLEEVREGNKIIALFMGYTEDKKGNWRPKCGSYPNDFKVNDFFSYHKNWGQLMLVVEKIESIRKPRTFSVNIFNNHCRIGDCKPVSHKESKIQATWQAVVSFLEWLKTTPPKG